MNPAEAKFAESVVLSVLAKNFKGEPLAILRGAEEVSGVCLAGLNPSNFGAFMSGISDRAEGSSWEKKFALGVLRMILQKYL